MPYKPQPVCSYPACRERAIARGRCALHPREDIRTKRENSSSTARGYGYEWQQIRKAHLKQYPYCVVCGELGNQVDHILPLSKGGTNNPDNRQTLCSTHHSQKTVLEDGGFGNKAR